METNIAIKADKLSKIYRLYEKPTDRLKESLSLTKKNYHKDYYALNEINLDIKRGEVVGIVGTNGSGKSTLLKIITGVLNPTEGEINVNGRVSALLELGAGFNPEYTGIENIYLNGTMMNKSKEEINAELEEIINFADIGEFIYQPVKTYSSGMFVRLAFAVATNIKPDILIVDEALSVGDINFQMKSINKIKELISYGTTVLFVSHDIITVKTLCNKALYLDKGKMIAYGDSGEICDLYLANQNKRNGLVNNEAKEYKADVTNNSIDDIRDEEFDRRANETRQGNGKARVINVIVEDIQNTKKQDFHYNEKIKVKIYFEIEEDIDSIVVAMYIRNKNQLELIGTNSFYENIELKNLKRGNQYLISYVVDNYLQEGEYGITVILADDIPTTEFYDSIDNIRIIKTYDPVGQKRWALVNLPITAECEKLYR